MESRSQTILKNNNLFSHRSLTDREGVLFGTLVLRLTVNTMMMMMMMMMMMILIFSSKGSSGSRSNSSSSRSSRSSSSSSSSSTRVHALNGHSTS